MSLLTILVIGVTGCSAYEPKPTVTMLKDEQVVTSTPSLRHVLVSHPDSGIVSCSEPHGDATFNQQDAIKLSLFGDIGGAKDSSQGGDSTGSGEDEMDGRTPAIMLTRELMFRLCEFSRNNRLSKEEATELYTKNLAIIESMATTQAQKTDIKLSDTISTTIDSQADAKSQELSGITTIPASDESTDQGGEPTDQGIAN